MGNMWFITSIRTFRIKGYTMHNMWTIMGTHTRQIKGHTMRKIYMKAQPHTPENILRGQCNQSLYIMIPTT